MNLKSITLAVLLMLGATACQNEMQLPQNEAPPSPMDAFLGDDFFAAVNGRGSGPVAITSEYLDAINEGLSAEGQNYRVMMAEYITAGGSEEAGQTILEKDVGNKQMAFDFVPNDPRRTWSGPVGGDNDNITYAIDQTGDAVPPGGGLTGAETDAAIERGTSTWVEATCSELRLVRNDDFGIDIGVAVSIFGLGGSPFVLADVQHAGWRDLNFGGGVLGVTFTLGFIDENGFTDIDNNGKLDVAFREIYYDPSWIWADDGSTNVDVESIAVHEIGHGLSQDHFGTVVIKNKGAQKASPKAVMNALYVAPFRDLTGSDEGGHCSIWAQWPNN